MNSDQIALAAVSGVLGLGVLGSYVPIAQDQIAKKHDYWLGIPQQTQFALYALWAAAAVGFLWYVGFRSFGPQPVDSKGLFSYAPHMRPGLVGGLLATSILWSVFVRANFENPSVGLRAGTSGSLIATAILTILLLAGEAETGAPWHVLLALCGFALTTVLVDGVMWNATFLVK